MEGRTNSKLISEAMLAEARAFQREVTRGKDSRGHGGVSSQRPGAYGSGAYAAAGPPRDLSRKPVAQNLATPDQFFGGQSPTPPSAPRTPTMPTTQQPESRSVNAMQVDPNPQPTGGGLVGSRWATSAAPTVSRPMSVPSAPSYAAINTGNPGDTMSKAPNLPSSFQNITLDTPEMPKASKGLLSSKWASGASPASPSPMTLKYPDPSTLEPVYRSEDWLSDLSAEYKELSVKAKNASETKATQAIPPTQTAKPSSTESQRSGQNPINFSAASQHTVGQSAPPSIPNKQASETVSGPSIESGQTTPSAQAASSQGGIFNDSAFKDWYNSQFMRRKA